MVLVKIEIEGWQRSPGKELLFCQSELLVDDFGDLSITAHPAAVGTVVEVATVAIFSATSKPFTTLPNTA